MLTSAADIEAACIKEACTEIRLHGLQIDMHAISLVLICTAEMIVCIKSTD